MLLLGVKKENDWLLAEYNLTYKIGWENICRAVSLVYEYYENVEILVDNNKVNINSKEEILQEIFQRTVQKITDKLEQFNMRTELYQVWLFLFKEVKKEARILSLAVDYNLEKLLTSAVFDFLEKQNSSRKEASTYMNSFWSSAVVSVLIKWTKDGMRVPAEKIASLGLPLFPHRKNDKPSDK